MNSQSLNLFPIPITKFSVTNWSEKKPELMKLIDFNGCNIVECQTDYYKYSTVSPYLNDFISILQEDLDNLVNEYTQLLNDRYKGDCPCESVDKWQLWSQRYTRGQYHGAHNHGLSNISCVLYVEFNPKEHFPTTFYSPFPDPYYGTINKIAPPVEEGEILTFPSVLLHEAPVSVSDKQRTIMSFNIPLR